MATVAGVNTYSKANPRLFVALFFFAPLIASILPRLTPLFLALAAFALVLAALRRGLTWRELLPPTPTFIACLALSLYVFINASWAWNPSAGFTKAALLLGTILVAFAAATAIGRLDDRQTRDAAIAFVAGASLGALYLLVELLTEGAIARFFMNTFPAIRPDKAKRIVIVDGEVTRMNLSRFNQSVTILMLHLWPGLLMLAAVANLRRALLVTLFFAAFATAVLLSKHDSSQLALLGSALVFAIAWRWRRFMIRALAVLWCLGFALVLPVSFAAYEADLHRLQSLPMSYKARIILWQYTSEQVLQNPWLGVGANTTRERDIAGEKATQRHDRPKGFVYQRSTGHHGHSIFLQTWYELGAIGAVLLAIAGAMVALRIGNLRRDAQPFAAATFAAFALIGAFAWGMWQTWWICAVALAAIYMCFAARSAAKAPAPHRQVRGSSQPATSP